MTADTDSIDDRGTDCLEYVVIDAAIKVKDSRREDVSVLMARKQQLRDRVDMMASDRDSGAPRFWGARRRMGWTWPNVSRW